ncbi:hypothetical protein BGZ79_010021 [Entomortierella chlamydospora]|nr:hypothetical protein BGZ79_010021 [Entomortierella chlamydospora]
MVASSSVSNPAPTIDWADDTDEEIDFGAPVFSDDEDLPPALTRGLGSTSPLPTEDHDHNRSELQNDQDRTPTQPSHRYTAGFADGSNRSLDRKTHNGSTLQPMSSRTRTGDRSSPYHDAPNSHFDRASSTNHHSSGARGSGNSFERESHWRSDSRRDNSSLGPSSTYGSPRSNGGSHWGKHTDDRGTGSGQRSARQVIPLPPKPPAALDANSPHINRSRSPSYRSHSPLPGTEHRRDNPRLRESSPYSDTHRSFSPSAIPPSGLSTRSRSPGRHSKAHMDQLSPLGDHSKWRSRDNALESRWEKTPHEDKPYPSLPPSVVSSSPKDDVIYFRRRDGRTNEPSNVERTTSGTMYHERLDHNDSRRHRAERTESSSDRWEKNAAMEPDRPYPERAHPPHNSGISSGGGHAKTKSRGQTDTAPVNHPSQHEKSSQRGNRGKGKDQQKRQSKDQPDQPETNADDEGSTTPWWEQSTYGKSKKDESKSESALQSTKESMEHKHINTVGTDTKESVEIVPKSKKSAKTTSEESEVPWWEQSTYKVKPKNSSVDQVSSGLANVSLSRSDSASEQRGDETMARRKALGKVTPTSGVEALTLVSREGDATG